MNAKEAKAIADDASTSRVFKRIEEAARRGQYGIDITRLSNKEIQKLMAEGYVVKRGEDEWTISWV